MTRDTSPNPNQADIDTAENTVVTPPFGTRSVFDAPTATATASWASTPLRPRQSFVSRRPLVTTAIAALWIGSLAAGLWMGRVQSTDSPNAAATAPTTEAPPATSPPSPQESTTTTEAPPPTYSTYGTDNAGQYEEVPPPETLPPPPTAPVPPTTAPPTTTAPQPEPTTPTTTPITPTTLPYDINESGQ